MISSLPYVGNAEDLAEFQKHFEDWIIVAIDVEGIDHIPDATPMEKLSEVGVAFIDMRGSKDRPKEPSFDNRVLAERIKLTHEIIRKWRWITEETCPVHRRGPRGKWRHTAQPYSSQFTYSHTSNSAEVAMSETAASLRWLKTYNRTAAEVKSNTFRNVAVLFWDAHLEVFTFEAAGLSSDLENDPNIFFYDFQKFAPFGKRCRHWFERHRPHQTPCGSSMAALGVIGVLVHNAANDAFAEVLGMARFLTMSADEYDAWLKGGNLSTIDLSWVDKEILESNRKMFSPAPPRRGRQERRNNNNDNNNNDRSRNKKKKKKKKKEEEEEEEN